MYEDTDRVLDDIKQHFEAKFHEKFSMTNSYDDKFAIYESDGYCFDVMAAFIQARIYEDFTVPIEQRIDDVLKNVNIEKNAHYRFASQRVNKPMPLEYCIDLVE